MPSFAELEAAGAVIGEIRIAAENIFDTNDPKEDHLLFRWANALHIPTRPSVIRRALLFKPGDVVSVRVIEETERLLRSNDYLYDVKFRPVAYHDGVVDIEVMTRDTWSIDFGLRASRAGGANSGGFEVTDRNLLGTGTTLSLGQSNTVDRRSNLFELANERAFGTQVSVKYNHATNSDGRSDVATVARPFYALDTRWATGVSASKFDRIDSIYNTGNVVSQYRHRQSMGEVFGGWSPGLIDGWVNRFSIGVSASDDAYVTEPGLVAPPQLPTDQRLIGPFVRYELVEDRFDRQLNRNLIGRPEFFALGLASTVQLGWASTGWGSSIDALLYKASIGRGFEPASGQTLMAEANLVGQLVNGRAQRQQAGIDAQYYLPQSPRWLFFAGGQFDALTNPDVNDTLLLGGDNGLRGYPLRYQSGTRRALFTTEERFFTDIYLWQLFRVGGAAFADVGRAWGGNNVNTVNPGWLSDVGFGLRIAAARSATGSILHIDIAVPLRTTPEIAKVQFLVKTKTTF
ncbi:MAG TPA: BamA/TamA family outer membrane protein [Burkholderiaceae bacterium]|nr:BamA/TamA family outer membrane protein [Burkholderiaceae bacterium]